MNNKYGEIPVFKWISIDKLFMNKKYQRDHLSRASKKNIAAIVENFSWSKFTPITAGDNGDGTFNIIDGGHLLSVVKMLGDIPEVPCWVVQEADIRKQSDDFVGINQNRVSVNPFQIFYAQTVAGDEKALKALKFCEDNGIQISRNGSIPNSPEITVALSFIKKNAVAHPKELSFVIGIIRQAFPGVCGQLKSDIMTCLLKIRLKNGITAEKESVRQSLIDTLREFGDVNLISKQALSAHATDKQSITYHYNRIFMDTYKRVTKKIKDKKHETC